jgi:hypothetical protein
MRLKAQSDSHHLTDLGVVTLDPKTNNIKTFIQVLYQNSLDFSPSKWMSLRTHRKPLAG